MRRKSMGKKGERGWFVVTDLYLINQVKLGLQHFTEQTESVV